MDFDEFAELARTRRSVRRFAARRVERAQINRLIELACWAPSNHNRQGWKFVVFQDAAEIRDLAKRARDSVRRALADAHRLAAGQGERLVHFAGAFEDAPVLILAMHKRSPALGRRLLASATGEIASGEAISTAMAVQNLQLGAHAMGLGTCVMTAPLFAGDVWRELADLPVGFEPTCVVALGYPAGPTETPRRKALEHVVEYR